MSTPGQKVLQLLSGLFLLTISSAGQAAISATASADGSSASAPGKPAATSAKAPAPKLVPAMLIKKDKISSADDPHLPESVKAEHKCEILSATYKVCISPAGNIDSVESMHGIPDADSSIIATIRQWRFKPQPAPICFIQSFEFHIEAGEECLKPERAVRWLDRRVYQLERGAASTSTVIEALRRRVEQLEQTCGQAPSSAGKAVAPEPLPRPQ